MKLRPSCLVLLASMALLVFPCTVSPQKPTGGQETNASVIANEKTPKGSPTPASKRPLEILNILSEANTAPPEFAADILIRTAASNKVQDPEWKREILEDAFRLASKAEHKTKLDYAGAVVDTREGYLALALTRKLDVLSLQARAITAMLPVDRVRAREMFTELSPELKLAQLGCEDALIPDVSDFYDAMKQIAKRSFTAAEVSDGAQLLFVQRYVTAMQSSVQVGPVAKVISSLELSPSELTILVNSFSEALKRIPSNYRTFTFVVFRDSLYGSFDDLAKACDKKRVSKDELLQSMRGYLLRNFTSQCADNTVAKRKEVPGFIKLANQSLLKATPIALEDIQPLKIEGTVTTNAFWESARSKALLTKLKQLRFGADGEPRSAAEKATPEWHQQINDFMIDFESWTASDEKSDLDYFHQKAVVYRVLSDVVPSGTLRDKIWRSNLTFLADGDGKKKTVEWFLHAGHFLDKLKRDREESSDLMQIIELSHNSILRTYAHFYQTVPN